MSHVDDSLGWLITVTHLVLWWVHIFYLLRGQMLSHFVDPNLVPKLRINYVMTSYDVIMSHNDVILTVERALLVSCIIKPAYWTVVELSRVERIGIPEKWVIFMSHSDVIMMSWWRHRLRTFFIDDDSTSNSLMGWDSFHYFFDFGHFSFLNDVIIPQRHDSLFMTSYFT